MVKTYQGYFVEDGQFVTDGAFVKLPTGRRAIVNILEDEVADNKTIQVELMRKNKVARIRKALSEAQDAEDELSEADWEEFKNLRAKQMPDYRGQ